MAQPPRFSELRELKELLQECKERLQEFKQRWGFPELLSPRRLLTHLDEIQEILDCGPEVRKDLASRTDPIMEKHEDEPGSPGSEPHDGLTEFISQHDSGLLWVDMVLAHVPSTVKSESKPDPYIDHHSFSAAFVADKLLRPQYRLPVLWWTGRQPASRQNNKDATLMVQWLATQMAQFIFDRATGEIDRATGDINLARHEISKIIFWLKECRPCEYMGPWRPLYDALLFLEDLLKLLRGYDKPFIILESPFKDHSPEDLAAEDQAAEDQAAEDTLRVFRRLISWIRTYNLDPNRAAIKILVTGSGWKMVRNAGLESADWRLCTKRVQPTMSGREGALGSIKSKLNEALEAFSDWGGSQADGSPMDVPSAAGSSP